MTLRDIIKKEIDLLVEERLMWTKEKVLDIAKNYTQMNQFKKNEPKAYNATRRNGWLDDVRKFMTPKYLNLSDDDIFQEARKYVFLKDFREQSPKYYATADYRNLLPKIKEFLKITPSSVPSLSPEDVKIEANKYKTKKEFREKSPLAYRWSIEYGLLGTEITHLGDKVERNPPGYWTYDLVKIEADKYGSRKEFAEKSPAAFRAAKQHGWYHELVKDMPILGSLMRRGVYVVEFSDNTVYVGLTDNKDRRKSEHLDPEGKTAVSRHIKNTGLTPVIKWISDYTDVSEAQQLEDCTIEEYKLNGWKVLNKAKAGGLGACKRKWTFDNVKKEAEKYNTKSDFKKGSPSAYTIAVREKWMDDISKHMKKKFIDWTPDMVYDISSKYDNLTLFLRQEPKAAGAARRLKIFDDVVKNMSRSSYDTTQKKKL